MKLWLLRPQVPESPPWNPWYDKAFGFVVRAETEEEARLLAQKEGGDEIRGSDYVTAFPAWLDSKHSYCVELQVLGLPMVIIRDFAAA